MSKILILTASFHRDKYIDELFQQKLIAKGHEVWIRPCPVGSQAAVLELLPDICIVPPIRNAYSRDLTETLKRWGIAVITRHTEPSCDYADFKRMTNMQKAGICGGFPYIVDLEIVWGPDEADILNKRGVQFPARSAGAFIASTYTSPEILDGLMKPKVFKQKYGFKRKKTILITSPWGFIDAAPDLHIDELETCNDDEQSRARYIEMIKAVNQKYKNKYNILLTLHPGVTTTHYKDLMNEIKIDTETPAMDLIVNSDLLIHSGSTMAIEMHIIGKPAIQYGDVNGSGWWQDSKSVISKVSPRAMSVDKLIGMIESTDWKSNANKKSIKTLEAGRYGSMDGKAIDRAVDWIDQIRGAFKVSWPVRHRDYDQLCVKKNHKGLVVQGNCGICGHNFYVIHNEVLKDICKALGSSVEKVLPSKMTACPACGSRLVIKDPDKKHELIKVG